MRVTRSIIGLILLVATAACSGSGNDKSAASGDTASSGTGHSGGTSASMSESFVPQPGIPPVAGGATLPKTGNCWNLDAEQLDDGLALTTTDQPVVDCSAPHTAITVGVVGIPAERMAEAEALAQTGQAIDPGHEQNWRSMAAPACLAAYEQAFAAAKVDFPGANFTYKSSTMRPYAWLPTADEWASGARWIRCDVANRSGDPVPITTPKLDLAKVPENLVACLNANAEGSVPMACTDPQVNAQSLVTIDLGPTKAAEAINDYSAFAADQANAMCAAAVGQAFGQIQQSPKAAMPIQQAFTGSFDCYVDRAAGDPLIT